MRKIILLFLIIILITGCSLFKKLGDIIRLAEPSLLWAKTYGGSDYDEAHSIQQTKDGGYIVAGETYSFGAGGEDFYIIKTE